MIDDIKRNDIFGDYHCNPSNHENARIQGVSCTTVFGLFYDSTRADKVYHKAYVGIFQTMPKNLHCELDILVLISKIKTLIDKELVQ